MELVRLPGLIGHTSDLQASLNRIKVNSRIVASDPRSAEKPLYIVLTSYQLELRRPL